MTFFFFVSSIFSEVVITNSDKWKTHEHCDEVYFDLSYIEEIEQAEWVRWELTLEECDVNVRRDADFREDYKVSTRSATPKDYTNSGYDRGHLANAQDFFFSKEAMRSTFVMSNISPQIGDFNKITWLRLEELDKHFVKRFGTARS